MIECKVMRTIESVEIEIMLILGLPCCLSSSSVRCLESDPYEAIRKPYLVGTDTESEPFKGEDETPESPHIMEPPKCHVEESEGSGTSSARSTSSDSTTPLLPDHPLTHTTPALFPILCRTACLAVRVPPMMSPGLSAGIAEVATMSDSAFHRRFRYSYDSSPSPTLPVQKRYRDTEDEGPTAQDEDITAEDEGLAAGVEILGVDDESYGLDDESYGLDDESYGLYDKSRGLDDKGHGVESDVLGFGGGGRGCTWGSAAGSSGCEDSCKRAFRTWVWSVEAPRVSLEEDHVYSTFEVGQGSGSASKSERPERVSASRQPTLTTWTDPEDNMVYIDVHAYPPPPPPVQITLYPSGPIALPVATSTATILVDEDQFIEVGAQLELYRIILHDHTQRLDAMPPTLFEEIDRDERTDMTFGALWRPVLALKAWAGRVDTRMADMSQAGYDDHRLVHDMLLQQTALQRELQEMRGRVTTLEQEGDRRERVRLRHLSLPHIVAPLTCHVEELEGSGTSGARSTSSDSTAPLLPDHPLTHTTPILVPIIHRTARMAMRVPLMMSPSLSAGIAEVTAMSDPAFHKRFRSSYNSLPSPTLPVQKRYRGTSELILGTDSEEDEEVEESLDSDSESEDVEDEGPTTEDEDPAAEDEGLVARVEGPGFDDESYGLDDESHVVDGKIYGFDDESPCIDDEGCDIESDELGLREEEAVPEGQQRAVSVVRTSMSEPLGLGYGALRHRELALDEDHVYSTFEVGQGFISAPEPERSERVSAFRQPTLTTWTDPEDGMIYIYVPVYLLPAPPIQTPPSPESPVRALYGYTSGPYLAFGRDATHFERTVVMLRALWRPMLALKAWAGRVDTWMIDMSQAGYDDHRLVLNMLLQQTALQRELQEIKDRVTVLE
nr:hypothetical protein [Tanacetum cinerariifolium]